jgi:uncharacterized membrane protein
MLESKSMFTILLAWKMGLMAGSRSLLAPAAVSWAASQGWLKIRDERLEILSRPTTSRVLAGLALGELVGDKLPMTPSRTMPGPFAVRIASGALCGYIVGAGRDEAAKGLIAGAVGAVAGTLGLRAARGMLANAFGRDWPAAIIEDAVVVFGAVSIAQATRQDSLKEWFEALPLPPRMTQLELPSITSGGGWRLP